MTDEYAVLGVYVCGFDFHRCQPIGYYAVAQPSLKDALLNEQASDV